MNLDYRAAAEAIAGEGVPVSIEPDGTCWIGTDDERTYLDTAKVEAKQVKIVAEREAARAASLAKLEALGLTPDDLAALIG